MKPASVYRIYDADGVALYIGVSIHPLNRMQQHKQSQAWWQEVATVAVDHYPSHREALVAEANAIGEQQPKYNHRTPTALTVEGQIAAAQTREAKPVGPKKQDQIERAVVAQFAPLFDRLAACVQKAELIAHKFEERTP